jgi:spermidine synthase
MSDTGLIYFHDGEIVAEYNSAVVYKMNKELFLEIGPGHNLWALESELKDYVFQLDSFPRGKVLEIGLGLGVVSRYLLTFPMVNELTTVEINKDVIEVHNLIQEKDRNVLSPKVKKPHLILHADGIAYAHTTRKKYDFVFIDCYDRIDEDTLPMITDMFNACTKVVKPDGKIMAWLDKHTPEPYYSLFDQIVSQPLG